jgi:hypothetical protein
MTLDHLQEIVIRPIDMRSEIPMSIDQQMVQILPLVNDSLSLPSGLVSHEVAFPEDSDRVSLRSAKSSQRPWHWSQSGVGCSVAEGWAKGQPVEIAIAVFSSE